MTIETILNYHFKNKGLLKKAITHTSVLLRFKISPFERLEFLGDRVLGLIIAEWLYEKFPKEKEGDLAKRQAVLVCKDTLIEIAENIKMIDMINVKHQDLLPQSGVLADAIEALIGALYLDGGLEAVKPFVHKYWKKLITSSSEPPKDPKTTLQELTQQRSGGKLMPIYELLSVTGPQHSPEFTVRVKVENIGQAEGKGPNKRQAERKAAQILLEKL